MIFNVICRLQTQPAVASPSTRKLEAIAEPHATLPTANAANAAAPGWTASTVELLKKGHVICYQLETW